MSHLQAFLSRILAFTVFGFYLSQNIGNGIKEDIKQSSQNATLPYL